MSETLLDRVTAGTADSRQGAYVIWLADDENPDSELEAVVFEINVDECPDPPNQGSDWELQYSKLPSRAVLVREEQLPSDAGLCAPRRGIASDRYPRSGPDCLPK